MPGPTQHKKERPVSDIAEAVNQHYGRPDLGGRILEALARAGKDLDALTPADLAPLDHFHIGGHDATLALASLAGLREEMRVLDIGCGIGGPARTLAAGFGCRVTGIDLTEAYCQAAEFLTARTGLSDQVEIRCADALATPFADASYDVVWTQHAQVNIQDKGRLCTEILRVLQPGGRFILHEVLSGPTPEPHFPVPWARDPAISFLVGAQELRTLIEQSGLRERVWQDVTDQSIAWVRAARATAADQGPPPLSPAVLLGPGFGEAIGNLSRNLEEGRIAVVRAVFEREG